MLQDKIETQKGENKILRQKLQSKSEALVILSQELDKVRNECEDYRELTRRYVHNAYIGSVVPEKGGGNIWQVS